MVPRHVTRQALGLLAFAVALFAPSAAVAQAASHTADAANGAVQIELGIGHESNDAPLFRFSPEGALVYLPGHSRLAGALVQAALSRSWDMPLTGDWQWHVDGRLDTRQAPRASDLDFSQLQANTFVRHPLAGGTAGVGLSLQQLWVARARFQRQAAIQLDWTWVGTGDRLVYLNLEAARPRHVAEWRDLDGSVLQASVNLRQGVSWPGVQDLDLMGGVRRDRNRHGYADLDHHGAYLRGAIEGGRGRLSWDIALMLQATTYRAALDESLPARREHSRTWSLGLGWQLEPGCDLRLNLTAARNHARPALYDNHLHSALLSMATVW